MQETQHTQHTAIRTAQKQNTETTCYKNIEDSQKHKTNIHQGNDGSTALERSATNANHNLLILLLKTKINANLLLVFYCISK